MIHYRTNLVEAVRGAVETVADLAGHTYRGAERQAGKGRTPCAVVWWDDEQRVEMQPGESTGPVQFRELEVAVRIFAKEKAQDLDLELDTLAADVERAVAIHEWSGVLLDIWLESTSRDYDELEQPVGALTQRWRVLYRVDTQQPSAAVL